MALLKVRWKSSDRQGGERRESIVIVTLRPANANATVTFGFLAESLCHALSNAAVSISLLSSAMNRCIKPISPGPELSLYGVPVSVYRLYRFGVSFSADQIVISTPPISSWQRTVLEPCRAVLRDDGTSEMDKHRRVSIKSTFRDKKEAVVGRGPHSGR
jgi:hypothetical protein